MIQNLSFCSSNKIAKLPSKIIDKPFPLTRLQLNQFEGVQNGIPIFDGAKKVSLKNIAFITKHLETLNLFRGCSVACSHCLKNAQAPKKGSETVLFEDLLNFVNGFKELSERIGVNVLQGNKYLSIVDDANPSDIPIKGLDGKHDVVEAMSLIYEKLRIPTLYVTSGWNKGSKYTQSSAENLAKMVETNPHSVKSVDVSINPFTGLMESSRNSLKLGNEENAKFYRNVYTSRMANTLATFINLFGIDKASIIYRHADDFKGNELVNEVETKKLYQEIYEKLKKIVGSKLEALPQLNPEVLTQFDKSHLIEPSGRARRYFPYSQNLVEQSQLIDESLNWAQLTPKEKEEHLLEYGVKCIDIDGKVYTTMPAINTESVNTPLELTVPTDIELNYINKNSVPIFSEIDLIT